MSRVVIVGSGVIGLTTAWHCARRGHEVTVVDRQPEKRGGCSFGNAGMVVPSHFVPLAAPGAVAMALKWMFKPDSPFYLEPRLDWDLAAWCWRFFRSATRAHVERVGPLLAELHLRSRAGFQAMADAGLEFGLEKRGLWMLCKTQEALEEEAHVAGKAREMGLQAEVMSAAVVAAREPEIEMNIVGGVLHRQDCHMNPGQLMAALEDDLKAMGARFVWEAEIVGWRTENGRVRAARTRTGDEIEGDEFVLCAGVWSEEVVQELDLNLPMQAGRGYSLTLSRTEQRLNACAILTEARVAVTPVGQGMRFGGTMEITSKAAPIRSRRVEGIVRSSCAYFPQLDELSFAGIEPWSGLRPCAPDGLPFLGRTRRWRNVVVATGHAMMGLSLAPATGEMVADLMDPGALETGPAWLSPDRF